MFNIPRKISDRFIKQIPKFQKILKSAKDRDINESDTVTIINDMLSEIFGYDKFSEVTSELSIRGTFCDLAIKVDEKIHFLVECKAVGLDLKDAHLKQAIDYGANKGIQWVILTNGLIWNLYKIRFEQPISYDTVFSISLDSIDLKSEQDMDALYVMSKEGLDKDCREDMFDKLQNVNKFIIGNIILSDSVISSIRKELRKFADDVKIDVEEILQVIEKDIIKREILDSEEALISKEKLKKHYRKLERQNRSKNSSISETITTTSIEETPSATESPVYEVSSTSEQDTAKSP